MKLFASLFVVLSFLVLCSCKTIRHNYSRNITYHISTVNNNVCKKLRGDVVLYAIFVDSEPTNPWTTHDINTTLDSINLAIKWIETQAAERGIPLKIGLDYHNNKRKIPIVGKFTRKSLSATLFSPGGLRNVNRWADKVSKIAFQNLGADTSIITTTKLKAKNKEKLIARLRDIYKTDNLALMFFINNYYRDEISIAINTAYDSDVEYSIVSFKKPSIITHEFLHLFGAIDLYLSPFDKKKKTRKRKELAEKEFPNEIMAFQYRDIRKLKISKLTEYLIGWKNELQENHKQMLLGNDIKVAKY